MTHSTPNSAPLQTPYAILRAWAKAYRDAPEHRFPSDLHAEFFPVDLEYAASELERAQKRVKELERALRFYAEEEKYKSGDTHISGMTRPVMQDGGKIARNALTAGTR